MNAIFDLLQLNFSSTPSNPWLLVTRGGHPISLLSVSRPLEYNREEREGLLVGALVARQLPRTSTLDLAKSSWV